MKKDLKRGPASTLDDSNSVEVAMVVRMRVPKHMSHSQSLASVLEDYVTKATRQKGISVRNYGSAADIAAQFPPEMGEAGVLAKVILGSGE
jgi:hypothetical protein